MENEKVAFVPVVTRVYHQHFYFHIPQLHVIADVGRYVVDLKHQRLSIKYLILHIGIIRLIFFSQVVFNSYTITPLARLSSCNVLFNAEPEHDTKL